MKARICIQATSRELQKLLHTIFCVHFIIQLFILVTFLTKGVLLTTKAMITHAHCSVSFFTSELSLPEFTKRFIKKSVLINANFLLTEMSLTLESSDVVVVFSELLSMEQSAGFTNSVNTEDISNDIQEDHHDTHYFRPFW